MTLQDSWYLSDTKLLSMTYYYSQNSIMVMTGNCEFHIYYAQNMLYSIHTLIALIRDSLLHFPCVFPEGKDNMVHGFYNCMNLEVILKELISHHRIYMTLHTVVISYTLGSAWILHSC